MDRASPSGRVQMDGSRAFRASAAWVTVMPRACSSRTTRSCIQGIWPNQPLLEGDVGDVSKKLDEDLEAALLVPGSLIVIQGEPLAHGGDQGHRLSPIDLETAPEGPVVLHFECGEAMEPGGFDEVFLADHEAYGVGHYWPPMYLALKQTESAPQEAISFIRWTGNTWKAASTTTAMPRASEMEITSARDRVPSVPSMWAG